MTRQWWDAANPFGLAYQGGCSTGNYLCFGCIACDALALHRASVLLSSSSLIYTVLRFYHLLILFEPFLIRLSAWRKIGPFHLDCVIYLYPVITDLFAYLFQHFQL